MYAVGTYVGVGVVSLVVVGQGSSRRQSSSKRPLATLHHRQAQHRHTRPIHAPSHTQTNVERRRPATWRQVVLVWLSGVRGPKPA